MWCSPTCQLLGAQWRLLDGNTEYRFVTRVTSRCVCVCKTFTARTYTLLAFTCSLVRVLLLCYCVVFFLFFVPYICTGYGSTRNVPSVIDVWKFIKSSAIFLIPYQIASYSSCLWLIMTQLLNKVCITILSFASFFFRLLLFLFDVVSIRHHCTLRLDWLKILKVVPNFFLVLNQNVVWDYSCYFISFSDGLK